MLGYSQAVRQRTLTPSLVGSNPAIPAMCKSSLSLRLRGFFFLGFGGRGGITYYNSVVNKSYPSYSEGNFVFCNALLKPTIINQNQIEAVDKRDLLCYNV